MKKYNFKFLIKNPTRSESAKCGMLNGFSAHLGIFLKSTLFLLTAALLTLGNFVSQTYGVSSDQHQEEEDFSYVSYKLEAAQAAKVLLEIGVSPEKVEEVLENASISESQKLALLFNETKGLWVFNTSEHGQLEILVACKWYLVFCALKKSSEEIANCSNRVLTRPADDIEEVAEETADSTNRATSYTKRVMASLQDNQEKLPKEIPSYAIRVLTRARRIQFYFE